MARKTAREAAFLLLYEWTLGGNGEDTLEVLIKPELDGSLNKDDSQYIENVTNGVKACSEDLDVTIGQFAVGWKTDRMARVDLTIMRIACYEILYREDIPNGVSVNEAIDLCSRYSTEESGSFVNGVLGNISRDKQAKNKETRYDS